MTPDVFPVSSIEINSQAHRGNNKRDKRDKPWVVSFCEATLLSTKLLEYLAFLAAPMWCRSKNTKTKTHYTIGPCKLAKSLRLTIFQYARCFFNSWGKSPDSTLKV